MNRGIPKSARDALANQKPPETHPSADLLNGYVERSLSTAETATVTAHLAACDNCREVVFLAGAAAEEPSTAAVREPARAAHWWKWAIPAVALLALISSVLVDHRQKEAQPRLAATQTTNETGSALPSSAINPPPAKSEGVAPGFASNVAPKVASNVASNSSLETKPASAERLRATTTIGGKTSAAAQTPAAMAGGLPGRDRDALASLAQPAASAAPPLTPEAVEHNVEATASASAASAAPLQAAVDQAAPPAHPLGALGHSSFKSGGQAGGGFGAIGGLHVAIAPPAHWRITSDGHLERSPSGDTWTRVLADQPAVFRAVAVVLNDIWAGGNNGALYHSIDGGLHWSPVALSADGHSESGAVVSIHFDDVWHGSVVTDSGASWSTADRGQTWSKQ